MAEKGKQPNGRGRLGSLLGQRGEDRDGQEGPEAVHAATPSSHGEMQAYEQDWYRSLKALAERQQAIDAQHGDGGPPGVVATAARPETAVSEDAAAEEQSRAIEAAEEPAPRPAEEVVDAAEAPTDGEEATAGLEPATGSEQESPAPEEPADAPSDAPSLTSSDVNARKKALVELIGRGLNEREIDQIGLLLLDPDSDIRRLTLEALTVSAERLEEPLVHQALQDPADEVRAAAVRLAAARGTRDLAEIAPLLGARRWPLTQHAALEVLPGLFASDEIPSEEHLSSVLASIAQIEPGPTESERQSFLELERAIGIPKLIETLSSQHTNPPGRLGAVRLLMEDPTTDVLRAVAPLTSDPSDEIRAAAESALAKVAELDRAEAAIRRAEEPEGAAAVEQAAEAEMIAALVRALQDPAPAVRDRARIALTEISRTLILDWVREVLATGDANLAPLAAGAAELLGLSEVATALLVRGAEASADALDPFVGALRSFGMEAHSVAGALPDLDPTRRPGAIRVLWRVFGEEALQFVRAGLTDPEPPVRAAALEVFAESGDQSVTDVARALLEGDASPAVRSAAIPVIRRADPALRLAALSQSLLDPSPDVRRSAVDILSEGLGAEAAEPLLRAQKDLDGDVRQAATRRLAALPERSALWAALQRCAADQREQLIGEMQQGNPDRLAELVLEHVYSPDPTERVLAIEIAGRSGTEPCEQATIQALQDPSAPVRRAATGSLANLRSTAAVAPLGRSLNDPDPEVRSGAVRALGVIDDEAVLGFLVSALNDPEILVREVASEVLTQWSSPAVAKRLAEVLAAPGLRGPAAELLTKMGASAVELMIDVLRHGDPAVVPVVGQLLGRIVGLEGFLERLSSMEPEQRLRAAEAVRAIGGTVAVDALIRALSDPDERVRIRSIQLLGDLGDARGLEAVRSVSLGDPVAEVVAAAEEAIARLGSEG